MRSPLVSVVPRRHSVALAAVIGVGLALSALGAAAQTKDVPASQSPIPGPAFTTSPASHPAAYEVDGFRSARFGMTEAEVRKAIEADFKSGDKAITKELNPGEQTEILNVTVPDLLANAGPARVSYIFGYSRHRLFYVNVLWTKPKKEGSANELLGPAAALRNYFLGYSFRTEGLLHDTPLSDGTFLLFQGSDEKGRTISLVTGEALALGQNLAANAAEHQWYVRLSYIEDPSHPDVFQLRPGTF